MNSIKKTNYENQLQEQWNAYKEEEWDEACYEEDGDDYRIDFKEDFLRQVCDDPINDVVFFKSLYEQLNTDTLDDEEICIRGTYHLANDFII